MSSSFVLGGPQPIFNTPDVHCAQIQRDPNRICEMYKSAVKTSSSRDTRAIPSYLESMSVWHGYKSLEFSLECAPLSQAEPEHIQGDYLCFFSTSGERRGSSHLELEPQAVCETQIDGKTLSAEYCMRTAVTVRYGYCAGSTKTSFLFYYRALSVVS